MSDKDLDPQAEPDQKSPETETEMREVPIQVMVPESVRRQVVLLGAHRGENIRTVVLRALRAIGVKIPDSEFGDRRGRRRVNNGGRDGSK